MASDVEICNRALQLLGAGRITSLAEDSPAAKEMARAYDPVRQRELRAHPWNFSIKRAQLAEAGSAPAFGRAREFPLPADFLRLLPPYPEDNYLSRDWLIEGRSILTDDAAPLNIRYVADVTDANQMDPLFREALAHSLAMATCEKLTQSNTKKAELREDRKEVIREAKRVNAIENVAQVTAEDEWITVRA